MKINDSIIYIFSYWLVFLLWVLEKVWIYLLIFVEDENWLKALQVDTDGVIIGCREKQPNGHKVNQDFEQKKNYQQQLDRLQRRLNWQDRELEQYKLDTQQQQLQKEQLINRTEAEELKHQQQQPRHITQQQQPSNDNFPQQRQEQLIETNPEINGRVPLYTGCQKLFEVELLKKIKNNWQKNPKQIIRSLLIDFISKDDLKLLTRTRKNDKAPIPEDCIVVIKGKFMNSRSSTTFIVIYFLNLSFSFFFMLQNF